MLSSALLIAGLLGGLYVAWNIGANDVANAMGTSVGSGALTLRRAIVAAAVFEFLGAVLAGSHVTETVRKGIVDVSAIPSPTAFMVVMLAALLAAGIWLQVATWKGLPVSTSHSIVGGVAGAGLAAAGLEGLRLRELGFIMSSWVLSPLIGAAFGFVIFRLIASRILNSRASRVRVRQSAPYLAGLVVLVIVLSAIYKGLKNLHLDLSFGTALAIASVLAVVGGLLAGAYVRRTRAGRSAQGGFGYVERHFGWLQVMTACYVAFAHGANDVANAVGPLAGIYGVYSTGGVDERVPVPIGLLVLGGTGIVAGLATWGTRVMETIGRRITELTPSRGFSAEFAAATTVLVCTKLGLPISTTHTLVGSVLGVGLARGISVIDLRVLRDILLVWVITVPVSFALAAGLYWGLAVALL